MALSGSCSGVRGNRVGWTCLLKPLLRHFFGEANMFPLFPGRESRWILGSRLPSYHNEDTSANCLSDSHSSSTARGCAFGSDARGPFLSLSGCCTSRTSLCSATRLTLLSYYGSANRALISFFEKLKQRMSVPR